MNIATIKTNGIVRTDPSGAWRIRFMPDSPRGPFFVEVPVWSAVWGCDIWISRSDFPTLGDAEKFVGSL